MIDKKALCDDLTEFVARREHLVLYPNTSQGLPDDEIRQRTVSLYQNDRIFKNKVDFQVVSIMQLIDIHDS